MRIEWANLPQKALNLLQRSYIDEFLFYRYETSRGVEFAAMYAGEWVAFYNLREPEKGWQIMLKTNLPRAHYLSLLFLPFPSIQASSFMNTKALSQNGCAALESLYPGEETSEKNHSIPISKDQGVRVAKASKKRRSGISLDRTVRLKTYFKSVIADLFSSAIVFKISHADILLMRDNRLFKDANYNRLPLWAKSYLMGIFDAKMDDVWLNHLEWRLSIDGKLLTSKEVSKLSEKEAQEQLLAYKKANGGNLPSHLIVSTYKRIDSEKSCHVWKNKNPEDALKPFSAKSI